MPRVNPTPEGGVDIYWDVPQATLLVSIDKGDEPVVYSGEAKDTHGEFSGSFSPSDSASLHVLACWIKHGSVPR